MKILALDPANHCGYAHSNGHRGVWNLGATDGDRLIRLADHLADAYEKWGFDLLAFEDATFGAGARQLHVMAMHNELRGIIKAAATRVGADFRACNPVSLKSFATGSGRAKKHDMIRAAKIKLGMVVHDDNVADALWVLAFAQADFPQMARSKPKRKRWLRRKKREPQSRMF